jgi:hypothetical protein
MADREMSGNPRFVPPIREKNRCGIGIARDSLQFPKAKFRNTNPMKNMKSIAIALFSGAAIFSAVSCDVKKTEDGSLPEVEVKGETKLPKYDVDAPHVEVEKEKTTIEVPKVKVTPASEDTHDQ